MDPVVIVGGGQAGVGCAQSLRTADPDIPIMVIADEHGDPYQRPQLSKEFMNATAGEPTPLVVRTRAQLEKHGIDYRDGCRVAAFDTVTQRVELGNGQQLPYSQLVLATGARNRQLPVPGADLAGIHALRTLDEARLLRATLDKAQRLVVAGAGFIGLELATAARSRGLDVTVLDIADRPMSRVLSETTSRFFEKAHTENGVSLRLGEGVAAFEPDSRGWVAATISTSGTSYPCDVVVVGTGITPNTTIAEHAGLDVTDGIAVDACLRTSAPHVWAIGDCARFPQHDTENSVRLESVQNATSQAKHLGTCLTGQPVDYQTVPWFWSHQAQLKLQIAGLVHEPDQTVLRGDPATRRFSSFCFRQGQLLGVETVNNVAEHMSARRILNHRLPLTPTQAADPDFNLKNVREQAASYSHESQ